uniref:Fe2OG dioxygenase domain-containing protein n=1 Tax=Chromera velia CCMP2878 TaxID=1169474 RepID=A0A0G4G001_9ALVE|mmetsp:Transcript_36300/g.71422  ORF Transcript_36300/g.71422 Transcript_36300/m.71422 type:complete len:346 (+) Transcript_36300:146-1183(+)|eukprot:Cvel_3979.t1-p1 / transcript=Cvel_3979.t1 / gene=Cvel_3979 / organism=Chromera_velia_CCMP2878 / gene_product=Deacetoxyvindoline 4-hydroxylase, putative / transcript_product=Deacetoxyvindoline 4-hydroxylase, putative / location=Cvel_scaffold169:13668-14986(+) / protein_length=345 / sequence_SO=supercontig / SO=protein_coding / is_pseudo=false
MAIPVVDFTPFSQDSDFSDKERLETARRLGEAFESTGFAVVVGHGVPPSTSTALRLAAQQFFSKDLAHKRRLIQECEGATAGGGYGVSAYAYMEESGAQLLGDFNKPKDSCESLTYRYVGDESSKARMLPELRAPLVDFEASVEPFRHRLLRACEIALGLPVSYLSSKCDSRCEGIRLAFYPNAQPTHPDQMRYGAHVDSYGLALVQLDGQNPGGLQVLIDENWTEVPFIPDSFVINVGALLSRWTSGTWKAAVHRVAFRPGPRLSIVSGAIKPREDVIIERMPSALPSLLLHQSGKPYADILVRDFIRERVALHRSDYLELRKVKECDATSKQVLAEKIQTYVV